MKIIDLDPDTRLTYDADAGIISISFHGTEIFPAVLPKVEQLEDLPLYIDAKKVGDVLVGLEIWL